MDSFNRGATVTPDIGYDPQNGEEFISYDNANIDWAGQRDQVLTEFDGHQDELLSINEFNGELEHEFENTHSDDFLRGSELLPEDIDQLKAIVGDSEQYGALIQWAATNVHLEFVEQFNNIMLSNDYPQMEEAIQVLYNLYLENWTAEDAYDSEEYEEQDFDQEQADYEYNNSVFEHFSEDGYQEMVSWASENLSPADIAAYDRAMDSPDHDYKSQMIQWLEETYNNAN
ncbi:hypothetical protein SynBIOSE41_01787 [Synechococcus sp. BIOS-E4-1]|uniref:hypothetical protein n=1 Tax=Synechococcus sp. BIOS-E4-1 TaxID=1400864 RepID=UPI001643FF4B|nr:hypothetical protein [Synechococcus sp. BIOS-E4-1]QNI54298.1 hypothetical protein SynBIOSE41_01787 [Synechococcus sp. BIOS-E4-1]